MSAANKKPPPAAERSWLARELQGLGEARDGILVSIAVIYILGFLSWATYSWRRHLGFVPILEAQYLVAGIPATPLVLALYLPWRLGVARPYDARLFNGVQLVAVVVAAIGGVAWYGYLLSFVVSFVFPRLLSYDRSMLLNLILYTLDVSTLALTAGVIFRPDEDQSRLNIMSRLNRSGRSVAGIAARIVAIFSFFAYFGLVFYWFWGINLYVSQIYPHLPQELGGAQPACADLVIDTKRAEKPLLERLGIWQPSAGSDTSAPPLRVQLLYNGDKEIIFTTGTNDTHPQPFEIPKEIVLGIIGCDQ